ncbi:clathrin interactor EPSIN 2-like, partial [Phalaenopsis equestris]|uniref:clathrin interactor EPSIN 2-like n=1 Tax=Phalaenopsis equestris TaxID=78828 RepID=UPI0009E521CA
MMKKALDQTVRELKREVNKKFLKVPTIEQKTLDATSNEPWGTRGPLMAEIAQASCNYNDYQLIMAVLWKRIQDTGKNWRHVYKALIVLEYLVIYGSERVIDDVRERAYQISTLSDFLYTDSNGRDQGSNVRRKAQILVALVNDKKRLYEVRHKAQSYKAKVSLPPLSSSARFIDEGGNREDDNYKVRANVASTYRSKCQSVDGYTNNSFDDYDRHSTRIDTSPSYEVATNDSWSTVQNKGRIAEMASMQKASSPSGLKETSSSGTNQAPESVASESAQAHEKEVASLDEFDPRGSVSAASTVESSGLELDIFGFSAVDYTDSSVSMRVISTSIPDDDMLTNSGLDAAFVASTTHAVPSEPYENPFGYPPSNAYLRMDFPSETNTSLSVSTAEIHLPVEKGMEAAQSHDFVNTLGGPIYAPDVANAQHFLAEPHSYASEFSAANSSNDILDGILPWTGPVASVSFQETEPTGKSLFLSQGLSAYSASHAQNSSETG